jgi:16S rRNA (guanine527-N7)-methyltransferase
MAMDVLEGIVSREAQRRLGLFESLLRKWNPAINLVARSSVDDIWNRHIWDSAQVLLAAPPAARTWADLGSGGGFPGLVIAAVAADARPQLHVTLVESDQRKATFLRVAATEMGISAAVIAQRIESVPPLNQDVVSARALAPVATLCRYAARHLASHGTAIFLKGAGVAAEIDLARREWRFDLETRASITDPSGAILVIRNLTHV